MKITKSKLKQLIKEELEQYDEQEDSEPGFGVKIRTTEADLKRNILYQKSAVYEEILISLLTAIKGAIEDGRDAKYLQGDYDRLRERFMSAGREINRRVREAGGFDPTTVRE